jgi:hypothetical protein
MRILLLTIACFISLAAKSQLFVIIDPAFIKPGLMYNYQQHSQGHDNLGIYVRGLYGRIDLSDFYADNIKVGTGIAIPLDRTANVYLGVNYNKYFNVVDDCSQIDIRRIKLVSLDIGMSLRSERFTLLLMEDFLNWESTVGFSYRLKK